MAKLKKERSTRVKKDDLVPDPVHHLLFFLLQSRHPCIHSMLIGWLFFNVKWTVFKLHSEWDQHIIQLKRWYRNGLGNEGFDGHQEHLGKWVWSEILDLRGANKNRQLHTNSFTTANRHLRINSVSFCMQYAQINVPHN